MPKHSRTLRALVLGIVLLCLQSEEAAALLGSQRVASGLARPVGVEFAPGDSGRMFVLEQQGRVQIVQNGTLNPQPFLDITSKVSDIFAPGSVERGFFGLAFHPDYAVNGYFYVYYFNRPETQLILERYSVSANPDVADTTAVLPMLAIDKNFGNHNGGYLAFGPDGYLYLGVGDGNLPVNAQDTSILLGKILRLDVDGGVPYGIPPGNPFAGPGDPLDEIWSYGLRNPWRCTFDTATKDFYIADVGFLTWEEINFQAGPPLVGGQNYGWNLMEGPACLADPQCDTLSVDLPIAQYSHDPMGHCSITGGHVYRGSEIPGFQGHYIYSDFCSGQIYSLKYEGGQVTTMKNWTEDVMPTDGTQINRISSFGQDHDGELYIVDWGSTNPTVGEVFKIIWDGGDATTAPAVTTSSLALEASPNPFQPRVSLRFELPVAGDVEMTITDVRGRTVRTIETRSYAAGAHELVWDGRDDGGARLAGGAYFVRLSTPRENTTRKVMLLR